MKVFSFDGKRMNATVTAPNGAINENTIFHFKQKGDLITAKYAGGKVTAGFLIGKISSGKFEFQYTQMHEDYSLHGGHSICEIDIAKDGRLKLTEYFEWSSGEKGINVIEELEKTPAK